MGKAREESPRSDQNEELLSGGNTPHQPPIPMVRTVLSTSAVVLSVAAACFAVPLAAEAYPRCSSFSYGIGHCVNSGWNNGGYQPRQVRYDNSDGLLLEQPRFQPSFGSSYRYGGGSGRYSPWIGW